MRKPGKKIGKNLYVHKSAIKTLTEKDKEIVSRSLKFIPKQFEYEILKINRKEKEVSFIESKDWDVSHEPVVGDSYKVNLNIGKITFRKGREKNPQIYHHKWMFVEDEYTGFNVEESKQRSKEWQRIPVVFDKKKIGNQDYWSNEVLPYIEGDFWTMKIPISTNKSWYRGVRKEEAEAKFPDLFRGRTEKDEKGYKPHPTQVKSTVRTYEKIFNHLKEKSFNGNILDASSGKGLGTAKGRVMGFNIEDVEPYPPKDYTPTYSDYSEIKKKYDVIICNMVLNVITQDVRDELVRKLFLLLNNGGEVYFIVRGKNEIVKQRTGLSFQDDDEKEMRVAEYFFPSKRSYQKGFTKNELFHYIEDTLKNSEVQFEVKKINTLDKMFHNYIGVVVRKI